MANSNAFAKNYTGGVIDEAHKRASVSGRPTSSARMAHAGHGAHD